MSETILVLPLILMIVALLVYFGRGMARVQRAQVMDRYEAWRLAEHAPGPYSDPDRDNTLLNQTFFADHARSIERELDGRFPNEAAVALREAGLARSEQAYNLIGRVQSDLPRGVSVRFSTEHAGGVGLWERFTGPIHHRHTRIGDDWRYANGWRALGDEWLPTAPGASNLGAIRDTFIVELDDPLAIVAGAGNPLAGMIRGFYSHRPPYVGPTVIRN